MANAAAVVKVAPPRSTRKGKERRELLEKLRESRASEFVFAVVGYAGSGTSFVATRLARFLQKKDYVTHEIKAREVLDTFVSRRGMKFSDSGSSSLDRTAFYQSVGDTFRQESGEFGIVAGCMAARIKEIRDQHQGQKNVYILDSLKHPDEVELLRHVYGSNFVLVGVGCRPDIRRNRLANKYKIDETKDDEVKSLDDFVSRDAEDSENKYGQQVNDTFHRSDFFVDNTKSTEDSKNFSLPEQLKRLDEIVFRRDLYRPKKDERGMYYAQAAAHRSSCLSRQVGASILDLKGNLLAVGTNEVPKAFGGAYSDGDKPDDRCYKKGYCSNTVKQNDIVKDIFDRLQSAKQLSAGVELKHVESVLKKTRVKSLIEFSRAVHAEMDALLTLVRSGTILGEGATLYSTTYPCHSCARHIVAAGVSQVVYLEPYSKSLAIDLHQDSIADNLPEEESADRVRFVPYQGVSPRLYEEVFAKRTDLKNSATGNFEFIPENQFKNIERSLWTKTYIEFEEEIEQFIAGILEEEDGDGAA